MFSFSDISVLKTFQFCWHLIFFFFKYLWRFCFVDILFLVTLLVLATYKFQWLFCSFSTGVPKNVPSLACLTEEGTIFFRTLGTFCTYRNCLHFFCFVYFLFYFLVIYFLFLQVFVLFTLIFSSSFYYFFFNFGTFCTLCNLK